MQWDPQRERSEAASSQCRCRCRRWGAKLGVDKNRAWIPPFRLLLANYNLPLKEEGSVSKGSQVSNVKNRPNQKPQNDDIDFALSATSWEMLLHATGIFLRSLLPFSSLPSWTLSRCPHSSQHHLVKTKIRSYQWPLVASHCGLNTNLLTEAYRVFHVLAACLPL